MRVIRFLNPTDRGHRIIKKKLAWVGYSRELHSHTHEVWQHLLRIAHDHGAVETEFPLKLDDRGSYHFASKRLGIPDAEWEDTAVHNVLIALERLALVGLIRKPRMLDDGVYAIAFRPGMVHPVEWLHPDTDEERKRLWAPKPRRKKPRKK